MSRQRIQNSGQTMRRVTAGSMAAAAAGNIVQSQRQNRASKYNERDHHGICTNTSQLSCRRHRPVRSTSFGDIVTLIWSGVYEAL